MRIELVATRQLRLILRATAAAVGTDSHAVEVIRRELARRRLAEAPLGSRRPVEGPRAEDGSRRPSHES